MLAPVNWQIAQTYSAELALPLLALDILGLVGFATLFWLTRQ
jgi:hypothetical protein